MDTTTKQSVLTRISQDIEVSSKQVNNVIQLLEDDNTIPFIARYRKELTGGLDEVQINDIYEHWQYAVNLDKRKEEVIRLIEEQGKLTEELKHDILQARKLQKVEDLYRPYKKKRRTRATIAKEKGLEPLADWLMLLPDTSIEEEARGYINEDKDVHTVEDAVSGAQDIVAEVISDDAKLREWIRDTTFKNGVVVTKAKSKEQDERGTYEMYYEYDEQVKKIVPHRVLAINRGEKEDILRVSVEGPEDVILRFIKSQYSRKATNEAADLIDQAAEDSYKRLIAPAIEREIRQRLTETADEQAIHIFSENLRHLLLQPPMKEKIVLGVDPAYRTGCKLAVIDQTGKVLDIAVIYPTPPVSKVQEAKDKVLGLIRQYGIEMIAVGNGTASRETERFIADVLKDVNDPIYYLIVNEAGASVYSASEVAREEFPNFQVEERSAVSIARRLQDPLSELVKIDPKSIGVGQYQHDVSQKSLNGSLTFVVETVVNRVGVNINTASASLLQYVSGVSKTVANHIVKQREEEGRYTNRTQLKKVPRLGNKTFVQCAGFLRVLDGDEPFDHTPIHPETYTEAKELLKSLDCDSSDIGTERLTERLSSVDIEAKAAELNIGVPTLKDIMEAISRPGRDPRDDVQKPLLKTDVLELKDLHGGMHLQGTVRNVVDFGAFVDVGVKNDGLVHISKLSNQFVKHPLDVVHVGQIVDAWVESVDPDKGRLALTMIPASN